MQIIKIEANENGAHDNLNSPSLMTCPDGWAIIPNDVEIPDSFPFVDVRYRKGVVYALIPREVPPTPPEPIEPTISERMDDVEDALIDTDAVNAEQDTRLDDLENAILELANIVGGAE